MTLFIRALYQNCTDSNGDYLASSFLQEPKRSITTNSVSRDATRNSLATVSQHNVVYFSSRTVYLDALMAKAVSEGFKQIVIVAAGYDSRAYRFAKDNVSEVVNSVQFFEVDLPQVIAAKSADVATLGYAANVEYIAADLANIPIKDALLNNAKFVQSAKTVYFVEGLVYYLPQAAVDSLYTSLGQVASNDSILAYDFANECLFMKTCPNLPTWEINVFLEVMELKKEPWVSGMDSAVHSQWLSERGFEMTELISFHDAKEKLNVQTWNQSPIMSQLNFVTAKKTDNVA